MSYCAVRLCVYEKYNVIPIKALVRLYKSSDNNAIEQYLLGKLRCVEANLRFSATKAELQLTRDSPTSPRSRSVGLTRVNCTG